MNQKELFRTPLIKLGDSYRYNQTTLHGWLDYEACRLSEYLAQHKVDMRGYKAKTYMLRWDDKRIPKYIQEILHLLRVEWITNREGQEANYMVFLTGEMEKFHETYLVG